MNFDLTDEQLLLSDTVGQIFSRGGGGHDAVEPMRYWSDIVNAGLACLGMPEDQGGFGGGVDVALVMDGIGRALAVEPFLGSAILCGTLIAAAGDERQRADHLPAIIGGDRLYALAHREPQARDDLSDVTLTATRRGDGWSLSGTKTEVMFAEQAGRFIVSARTAGARFDENGISLFIVDPSVAGITIQPFVAYDGEPLATVKFDDIAVSGADVLGGLGEGFSPLARAYDAATAAIVAEGAGLLAAMVDETADYLKNRKQFDRAIGSFQVLQHRAVDMLMAAEKVRVMAMLAASALTNADPVARARSLSAAKIVLNRSARFVSQNAVQLHGGIGITEELMIGRRFKRATTLSHLFGDTDHHLRVFCATGGFLAPDEEALTFG